MLIEDTFIYAKENNISKVSINESIYDELSSFHHLAGENVLFTKLEADDHWIVLLDETNSLQYTYTALGFFCNDLNISEMSKSGYTKNYMRAETLKYGRDNEISVYNGTLVLDYFSVISKKMESETTENSFLRNTRESIMARLLSSIVPEELENVRLLATIILADDEEIACTYSKMTTLLDYKLNTNPYKGKIECILLPQRHIVINTELYCMIYSSNYDGDDDGPTTEIVKKVTGNETYTFMGEEYLATDQGFVVLTMTYIDNHHNDIPESNLETEIRPISIYEAFA